MCVSTVYVKASGYSHRPDTDITLIKGLAKQGFIGLRSGFGGSRFVFPRMPRSGPYTVGQYAELAGLTNADAL